MRRVDVVVSMKLGSKKGSEGSKGSGAALTVSNVSNVSLLPSQGAGQRRERQLAYSDSAVRQWIGQVVRNQGDSE